MTGHHEVRVPPRYARVNPWVISRDTDEEVRFLTSVFGAVETPGSRMLDPDGDVGHVEVELGDTVGRFSDPAALEAMAYVQRTLREELSAANEEPN